MSRFREWLCTRLCRTEHDRLSAINEQQAWIIDYLNTTVKQWEDRNGS